MSIYEYLTEEVTEESVDSILENAIVDGVINEEYIQEMVFSKKDLQDPKILDKLLKKAEKEKNIKSKIDNVLLCLTIAEAIATGVLSGSATIGIAAFVGFVIATFKIINAFNKVMYATQKKRIRTLQKKCKALRDKMAKSNDPNAKKIVAKCDAVLKSIDDHYKKLEDEKFRKRIDNIKYYYEKLVNITNGEDFMEEPDKNFFILAKLVHIPASDIDKGMKIYANKNKDLDYVNGVFQFLYSDNAKNKYDADKWFKLIPEFAKKEPVCIYYAIDDTFFLYSAKANKFVWGDYFVDDLYYDSSIYDMCENDEGSISEKDLDAIKVADIELGYYRITEPEK